MNNHELHVPWSSRRMNHANVFCTIRGIMNKLTPGKFDVLKAQLIQCLLRNPNALQEFVCIIFGKAVVEMAFCSIYARLCADLSNELPLFPCIEEKRFITFKQLLLFKCQQEFEDCVCRNKEVTRLPIIGITCFLGELYKHNIVIDTISHWIIQELFKPDAGKLWPTEEHVEAICQFLATTGVLLDSQQNSAVYFSKLKYMAINGHLSTRLRFMVFDLLELRSNKWVAKHKKVRVMRAEKLGSKESDGISAIQKEEFEKTKQISKVCRKYEDEDEIKTRHVFRNIKGILSKMSSEKFDDLKAQLIDCLLRSPKTLQGTATLIFEKAVMEPTFCAIYGRLCADLNKELPPFPSDELDTVKITFKRILVDKCQKLFESSVSQKVDWRVKQEETKFLPIVGVVRFFGELLKHKILTDAIGHRIIQALFTADDGRTHPSEERMEAICQFFKTLGNHLEYTQEIEVYFTKLNNLVMNGQLGTHLRFMVQDVLELRVHNLARRCGKEERGKEIERLELTILETEKLANEEKARREIAEKDATDAFQTVIELEIMYAVESSRRKEVEDSFGKEKEEHDNMKHLFVVCKKERDDLQEKLENATRAVDEVSLQCKKELDETLAKEKGEHEKVKQLYEVCKKERDDLREERDNAMKAVDEVSLECKKKMDETLAKEKEEHEKVLETCKKEIEDLKEERDNALKMTEEILRNQAESSLTVELEEERQPPSYFICPISQEVMEDPNVAADGFTYEGEAIRKWINGGHATSPMTNLRLPHNTLTPNLTLRSGIREWLEQ